MRYVCKTLTRSGAHSLGSRNKILDNGQPGHLCQVAHGPLSTIRLPVGIRNKTDCCIEGQVRRDPWKALGVQRQYPLQAQYKVQQERNRRA